MVMLLLSLLLVQVMLFLTLLLVQLLKLVMAHPQSWSVFVSASCPTYWQRNKRRNKMKPLLTSSSRNAGYSILFQLCNLSDFSASHFVRLSYCVTLQIFVFLHHNTVQILILHILPQSRLEWNNLKWCYDKKKNHNTKHSCVITCSSTLTIPQSGMTYN